MVRRWSGCGCLASEVSPAACSRAIRGEVGARVDGPRRWGRGAGGRRSGARRLRSFRVDRPLGATHRPARHRTRHAHAPAVRRAAVPTSAPRDATGDRQRRLLPGPCRHALAPGQARPGTPLRARLAGLEGDRDQPGDPPHRPGTIPAGYLSQHVVPSYDLRTLITNSSYADELVEINPRTGRRTRTVPMPRPYNLYYTPGRPDGRGDGRAVRHHPVRRRAHVAADQGPDLSRLPGSQPCRLLRQRPLLRGHL